MRMPTVKKLEIGAKYACEIVKTVSVQFSYCLNDHQCLETSFLIICSVNRYASTSFHLR